MRYAMVMAGGSGTRLWPMSRDRLPKQLIPFIHGQSLLSLAMLRLEGIVPADRRYICAGVRHRETIVHALPHFDPRRYLGEPVGRDTLSAVGFAAAVIARQQPDAIIAVFSSDHVIEPVSRFQHIVDAGFKLIEASDDTVVTFGITPTHAATGYGYLRLGSAVGESAHVVDEFKEKPNAVIAQQYHAAGPDQYLWNSGMFIWRAKTLLGCIERYEPDTHAGLMRIADAWDTPERDVVLNEVYPTLKKISVDFAVMEPASRDPRVRLVALPMDLTWLDVGSWPSFAQTCDRDSDGNALAAGTRHLLLNTKNTLIASSDPNHLVTTIGCEDLIVIHTPDATLVCKAGDSEQIKQLHARIAEQYPDRV